MLKRIMIALDESGAYIEHPDCALDCAAEMAQRTGAELSMVHVEAPSSSGLESLTPYRYEGVVEAEAAAGRLRSARTAEEMGRFQEQVADRWDVESDSHVSAGAVRTTVEQMVKSLDGDMIVARFGEHPCPAGRLASLSERVMREARVPVLFLPGESCMLLHGLDRALVPLDGSKQAEMILPVVRELLPAGTGTVHLLAVAPTHPLRHGGASLTSHDAAERYLISVARRPELQDVNVERTVLMGVDPADAIQTAAERVHANFVAMTTRGHSGLARLLLGSLAHQVLEQLRVPLLVWHPARSAAQAAEAQPDAGARPATSAQA